jgi:hypothetical protein
MFVYDDGSGSALYLGGGFTTAGGIGANHTARWDGVSWSPLAGGVDSDVLGFARFDDGSGPVLVAAGTFLSAGGRIANHVAVWDGAAWSPEHGAHVAPNDVAAAATGFDDGTGRALYVGGMFTAAGDADANHVARWDGASWTPLASGADAAVQALTVFDDGSGSALYAGGLFTNAGGQAAAHVAKWDGSSWTALAGGLDAAVFALLPFDDGSGPALYAAGGFTHASGTTVNHIARWNGAVWTDVGGGLTNNFPTGWALAAYDDGTGPALYVAGTFGTAGGTSVGNIARWNGSSWSSLANGVVGTVYALTVLDLGAGPALYAGGTFGISGQVVANIAKWNGSTWSPLAAGVNYHVRTLAGFDDGAGPALYVGGGLTSAGGQPVTNLAEWDGAAWSSFGMGADAEVWGLTAYDLDASGAADLFALGAFRQAGNVLSWHVAEWEGCGHTGTRFCAGDGTLAACPCGNSGFAGHGCENAPGTGGAVLEANGAASLSADGVHVTASGVRANVLCILLQGDAQTGPAIYGDGLRCTGGHLFRLFARAAVGNVFAAPAAGEPSISARSLARGDPLSAGAMRVYQVFYRDPSPTFCPDPPGGTFNASSAVRIDWLP